MAVDVYAAIYSGRLEVRLRTLFQLEDSVDSEWKRSRDSRNRSSASKARLKSERGFIVLANLY
jgi:hypothetical protein